MNVRCRLCGERPAPNESGACSECAAAQVREWRKAKEAALVKHKGETVAERRARLSRMGERDYFALREGADSGSLQAVQADSDR